MTLADTRVGDQQVDLARLGDHPLDRGAIGDVDLHPLAADLTRDRLDLRAAARAHDDVPAVARQRPRDTRSDPAAAAGHKRSHRTRTLAPSVAVALPDVRPLPEQDRQREIAVQYVIAECAVDLHDPHASCPGPSSIASLATR